jgi:ABC-type polysaccharide/polyol phosphate transport system ATPase subunit
MTLQTAAMSPVHAESHVDHNKADQRDIVMDVRSLEIVFPVYSHPGDMSLFYTLAKAGGGRFKRQGNRGAVIVHALRNISFKLREGERLGIIGRNGSGKSTLLRAMGGYIRPFRGSINVRGTVGTLIDLGIGVSGDRSAYENVQFTGKLAGLNKEQMADFQEDVESFADIGAFYHLPFDTYSTGMKLRVIFAMVTHFRRDILVVDEIFGVGDAHFADKAYDRMVDMVGASKSLVLATHSQDLLRSFCTQAIWLEGGLVMAEGAIDDVLNAYIEHT